MDHSGWLLFEMYKLLEKVMISYPVSWRGVAVIYPSASDVVEGCIHGGN